MKRGQRYLYYVHQNTLMFSSVVDKIEKLYKLFVGLYGQIGTQESTTPRPYVVASAFLIRKEHLKFTL
jgi:hypothetical protein